MTTSEAIERDEHGYLAMRGLRPALCRAYRHGTDFRPGSESARAVNRRGVGQAEHYEREVSGGAADGMPAKLFAAMTPAAWASRGGAGTRHQARGFGSTEWTGKETETQVSTLEPTP
jgi:hypothetical protein